MGLCRRFERRPADIFAADQRWQIMRYWTQVGKPVGSAYVVCDVGHYTKHKRHH